MPRDGAITVPFVGAPGQRGTGTGDERFVNFLFELVTDPITKTQELQCVKRPALVNSTQPPAGVATGRGVYAWGATGKIYSVFANKIYVGTVADAATLAGSTGRVWFAETPATASAQLLIISDGADNYNITTGDVVTQIDEVDDAEYPASNLGPIDYLDGHLLQGQSNGKLWQTDKNDFDSWTAGGFASMSFHGDALEAHHLQGDKVLAFGKKGIEVYFHVGNPSGSVLLRIEQNIKEVGLASKATLAWSGGVICFVGENASGGDGGRAVYMIHEGLLKDISGPVVNRFLAAEGTNIATASAWMERVAGQLVYLLNLDGAERSFVYNVDNNTWTEWEAAAGSAKFPGAYATSLDGVVYVQDAANGRIYTFSPTTYQDSGANFTNTIQKGRTNYGSGARKFEHRLRILGDNTTGNLNVSYSDNDGTSYNTARTIDLSKNKKELTRLGSFYERIYRYTYADNYALRLQAVKHYLEVGAI